MYHKQHNNEKEYNYISPMLDKEFDDFELNSDLEINLRESDSANFYHDALDLEE